MARPKKVIDYKLVEQLGKIMCTQEEIAGILGISVRTLQRDDEFCRIYKDAIQNGKASIRRNQFKLSEVNASMAIWLGKQYLYQKDHPEDGGNKQKVEIKFVEVNGKENT